MQQAVGRGDTRRLYRTPFLWRVHAASGLLIVPQFAVAAFSFDYLVSIRGWATGSAGVLLGAASAVSVSTNGLSNTAVTERAGPAAAGRVMGAQNSGQNLVGAATPPLLGALIVAAGAGAAGYALAFAVGAVAAAAAVPCIPVRSEQAIGADAHRTTV